MRETITGNKALAETLGVHFNTIQNWKKSGTLAPAILCEYGRTIIYDLEKVYECLNYKKVSRGRKCVI